MKSLTPLRSRSSKPRDRHRAKLVLEALEDRTLLACLSLEAARGLLDQRVSGATIVTHGFQPNGSADLIGSMLGHGDSLRPLADAIWDRSDGTFGDGAGGWLLDYDVNGDGGDGCFEINDSILPGTDNSKWLDRFHQ